MPFWGGTGGPSSASAVTQALRWLNPPAGTVLHARSVETQDGRATTREVWQSADDPASQREVAGGVETASDGTYDARTNTIYRNGKAAPAPRKRMPSGDAAVQKVRILLQDGRMNVTRARHDGVDAWAISLKHGFGRPVWTLWVAAADGKPLELRDPADGDQVIRWSTYEVLRGADADEQLTLKGAHPSARVVTGAPPASASPKAG